MTVLVLLGNALIYGNTLEAFSIVQTLLALGVPGSRVVLVQPPVPVPSCFNNPFIEDAVAAALKESGEDFLLFLFAQGIVTRDNLSHNLSRDFYCKKRLRNN